MVFFPICFLHFQRQIPPFTEAAYYFLYLYDTVRNKNTSNLYTPAKQMFLGYTGINLSVCVQNTGFCQSIRGISGHI